MNAPMRTRLFCAGPLAAGVPMRLDADASHHATRVLRLAAGDAVELFDGTGLRWPAHLGDADPKRTTVIPGDAVDAGLESPLAIGLAQALPAGDKMDWVIEKAVELGVDAVQPVVARRSIVRLDAERAARRLEHWRRIAVAACMQCGRDRVPTVAPPLALERWLADGGGTVSARPRAAEGAPQRWLLSPRGTGGLGTRAPAAAGVWLLAGPESGFDDDEVRAAEAAGWQALRLGPRTLRAETAGLAALAAMQARFGDF
jgi:16S rRNA (uracil1498-N3)-methyltransferase